MVARVALLVGVLLSVGLVEAAPARAQGFTMIDNLDIAGVPGPSPLPPSSRNCNGPGGACMLKATLFLPDPLPPGGKAPAVLSQHGFPGDRQANYVLEAAKLLASEGYVVLTWDARGFGQSQGYVMLNSPDHEALDVAKMIDFLAGRDEVLLDAPGNPRLGLYGQSYGGGNQFIAAALDPRIDVLVARETWNDLVYSLFTEGIIKQQFITLLFLGGQAATQGNLAPELSQWLAESYALNDLPVHVRQALRARSPAEYAGQVARPTFILQGERDTLFNLVEGSRNLAMISATGAPTKLFWYWGGHGGYANYPEGNRTWDAEDIMEGRQLRWLDRYLKGDASVDTGPAFEYFDGSGELLSAPVPPPIATVSLEMGGVGLTFAKPPGRTCPQFGVPTCSYSELSNFSAPGQPGDRPHFDPPGTFAAMDTQPLSDPLPVLGNSKVVFRVTTATGQPVSLFWKFFDVAPDGSARLINRLVSPVRAGSGDEITLDLAGFAYTFPPGNRMRLMVATTDAAYFPTDPADQVTLAAAPQLVLPVVSGAVTAPQPGRAATTLEELAATGSAGPRPSGYLLISASLLILYVLGGSKRVD